MSTRLMIRMMAAAFLLTSALLIPACQSTGSRSSAQARAGSQDQQNRQANRSLRLTVFAGDDEFLTDR